MVIEDLHANYGGHRQSYSQNREECKHETHSSHFSLFFFLNGLCARGKNTDSQGAAGGSRVVIGLDWVVVALKVDMIERVRRTRLQGNGILINSNSLVGGDVFGRSRFLDVPVSLHCLDFQTVSWMWLRSVQVVILRRRRHRYAVVELEMAVSFTVGDSGNFLSLLRRRAVLSSFCLAVKRAVLSIVPSLPKEISASDDVGIFYSITHLAATPCRPGISLADFDHPLHRAHRPGGMVWYEIVAPSCEHTA